MRRWCGLLLTLWLALVGADAVGQQFRFQTYGDDDGLSNSAVGCLLQDHDGFVWVCTENGLFRFDGRRFERATPKQQPMDVRSIARGPGGGALWLGTAEDLYERTRDGVLRPIRPGGHSLSMSNLGQQIVPLGADALLILYRDQAWRLTRSAPGAWTQAPLFAPERVAAEPWLGELSMAFLDTDGVLWLGCGTRLCAVRGIDTAEPRVRVWSAGDGVREMPWRTLLRDRAGRLWARGLHGVAVLAPGSERFEPRDPPGARLTSGDRSAPMIEDAAGRIVTRNETGLAIWDGSHWHSRGTANGLPATLASSLLSDQDGGLWVGDYGRGVSRWLGYGQWEGWTAAQGIEHEVVWNATRIGDGSLLLNTSAGCRRLRPGAMGAAQPCGIAGLPKGLLFGMQRASDGAVALGLRPSGLYRVDRGGRTAVKMATLPRFLMLMLDADGDSIWAATNDGPYLVRRRAGDPTAWHADNPSGIRQPVSDMARGQDGSLWFLVEDDGLVQRTPDGRWRTVQLDPPDVARELTRVTVGPDGSVWLGMPNGLARLALHGDGTAHVDRIAAPLLQGALLTFLRFDTRGWLWIGTDIGLVVFDGKAWRLLDRSDGLLWNDTNSSAFFEDADGSLWIGTSGGLAHLLRPQSIQQPTTLTARIVAARYGTRSLTAAAAGGGLQLPWESDAAFDVRVAAMRPGLSKGSAFRYRIVGLSNQWFETDNPDIHTPSLEPGDYRLEVVAVRPSSALVSEPATLAFHVVAPWWRSAWFRTLLAAAVAAGVAFAWRRHARTLRARQRHLERLLERATRDPLTGLWNRATILDLLATRIAEARAHGGSLAIAMIDIDHFKRINDTHGHLGGDAVLRALGRLLTANVREGDAIGRYGGEELLLVMPGTRPAQPLHSLERLRQLIAETDIPFEGSAIRVTASLGVEWLDAGTADGEALIGRADIALYAAKAGGRNRIAYAGADTVLPSSGDDGHGPGAAMARAA